MGARHRFARHKHIRASGQRSANDLGRTNSRRNKAGAQYCFSCTSICRFVFSTISICLANNTFNLFYPFCSSLHSCTRTLPRQCCHSMEGQFFCCPHSLRRKIRGVSRFDTIGVFDVVHGSAAPVALFVALAVFDGERDLRELGHHAEKRRHPHPEHGAGAA